MRKTILFPRKRIASRALQEKSKVKTRCFRIGSYRLYAPMVPLAPHPCVRWWNTKMMPLKLTRLCLHSLRGGSTHQNHPISVGAGSVWVVGVWQPYGCVERGGPFFDGPKNGPPHPPRKPSGQDQVHWSRLDTSLRSHGPPCPAPVRTLVEH